MQWEDLGADTSPAEVLVMIKNLFRDLGIFEQTLTLTHRGHKYLARCDAHGFTVYRCLDRCHFPPGDPGWPVCLVTADAIIDENSPPHAGEDEFASGLGLADWLHLIEDRFKK
jgi:hypothetical protein